MIDSILKRRIVTSYDNFLNIAEDIGYTRNDTQDMFVNMFEVGLLKGNSVNSVLNNISSNLQRG